MARSPKSSGIGALGADSEATEGISVWSAIGTLISETDFGDDGAGGRDNCGSEDLELSFSGDVALDGDGVACGKF